MRPGRRAVCPGLHPQRTSATPSTAKTTPPSAPAPGHAPWPPSETSPSEPSTWPDGTTPPKPPAGPAATWTGPLPFSDSIYDLDTAVLSALDIHRISLAL